MRTALTWAYVMNSIFFLKYALLVYFRDFFVKKKFMTEKGRNSLPRAKDYMNHFQRIKVAGY